MLAGCQLMEMWPRQPSPEQTPTLTEAPSAVAAPVPTTPTSAASEPRLTASEYLARGIERLQVGDETSARADLERVLELRPRNRMARSLIEQMDADPEATFGDESFAYTVQSGDTLSFLAQRFLDDPLEFYLLARYNRIENPSLLRVGQTVRIPGRRPAVGKEITAASPEEAPAKGRPSPPGEPNEPEEGLAQTEATEGKGEPAAGRMPPPERRPETPQEDPSVDYPVAKLLFLNGDYEGAIRLLENATTDEPSRELLVRSYRRQAERFAADGRLPEARSVLASASALEPNNQEITMELAAVDDRIEANLLYEEGLAKMASGDFKKAYASFNQALVYQPEHSGANEKLAVVKETLIEGYLQEAAELFAEERIDTAIDLWDKVLELDPDNEVATTQRAVALKTRERAGGEGTTDLPSPDFETGL